MTAKALRTDEDEIPDYGTPPGYDHLTFEEFIQEGEDDIAAGRIVPHEQVVAWFEERYGKLRAQ